jgi:hypothetical protein
MPEEVVRRGGGCCYCTRQKKNIDEYGFHAKAQLIRRWRPSIDREKSGARGNAEKIKKTTPRAPGRQPEVLSRRTKQRTNPNKEKYMAILLASTTFPEEKVQLG